MKLFKPMPKDQRLARRRFFQLIREYDELRARLESMYNELMELRQRADLEQDVGRPVDFYEAPELYDVGRTVYRRR